MNGWLTRWGMQMQQFTTEVSIPSELIPEQKLCKR